MGIKRQAKKQRTNGFKQSYKSRRDAFTIYTEIVILINEKKKHFTAHKHKTDKMYKKTKYTHRTWKCDLAYLRKMEKESSTWREQDGHPQSVKKQTTKGI